jgi:hypothetical protein
MTMDRYIAVIEFDAEQPLDEPTKECVTGGLWVAIDDPSNDEGEGIVWSGRPTNVVIAERPAGGIDVHVMADDIVKILTEHGLDNPHNACADILKRFGAFEVESVLQRLRGTSS